MKTQLDIEGILSRVMEAENLASKVDLAAFFEVNKSTVTNWVKRDTIDFNLLFSKCKLYSKDWLLSGEGTKLRADVISGNMSGEVVTDNSLIKTNIGKQEVKLYKQVNKINDPGQDYSKLENECVKLRKANKELTEKNKELTTDNIKLQGQVELLADMLAKKS